MDTGDEATPDGRVVLVIDDEKPIAEAVARYLTLHGWDARVRADPRRALAEAIDDPPFAVVTDLDLPGLDGATLARRLRRALGERAPRIVYISADTPYPEDAPFAAEFFAKPFRASGLGRRLGLWPGGGEARRSSGTRLRRPEATDDADPKKRDAGA